jgi:hypothetical protein
MIEILKIPTAEFKLSPSGVILPGAYYKKGLLYSTQKDAFDQERLSRAIHSSCPIELMQRPDGSIAIWDGHHRTGLAIINDEPLAYYLRDFNPNIRVWPFRYFMNVFKRCAMQLGY